MHSVALKQQYTVSCVVYRYAVVVQCGGRQYLVFNAHVSWRITRLRWQLSLWTALYIYINKHMISTWMITHFNLVSIKIALTISQGQQEAYSTCTQLNSDWVPSLPMPFFEVLQWSLPLVLQTSPWEQGQSTLTIPWLVEWWRSWSHWRRQDVPPPRGESLAPVCVGGGGGEWLNMANIL